MSTRYVWERYSTNQKIGTGPFQAGPLNITIDSSQTQGHYYYYGDTFTNNGNTVTIPIADGRGKQCASDGPSSIRYTNLPQNTYGVFRIQMYDVPSEISADISEVFYASTNTQVKNTTGWSGPNLRATLELYNYYKLEWVDVKGSLQGYASSATDGQYPADGVSGNVSLFAHTNRKTIALQGVA